jgi:ATPase subunit of ABC transporter with duplicated ATPase domains
MNVIEVWADTGKSIERDFTPEELQQREADAQAHAAAEAERVAAETAQTKAREAALSHAKSLGFTDEMIAVRYPNLSGV